MVYMGVKRKVFISFCQRDRTEVEDFIDLWANQKSVFVPKVLGIFDKDKDDFIDSDNPEYVMSQIRKKYLGDSTVTMVLVGRCTHSRRYVDWELKTSLRKGTYTPNGVMGIILPSCTTGAYLPPRLAANWNKECIGCYARCWVAPTSVNSLVNCIEDAYAARTSRAHLIKNDADMMKYNAKCRVCGITH